MRVERVVLEHHGAVAVLGFEIVDDALADDEFARGDLLEARHHAQQGRLAAARRAHDHDELAVPDVERDAVHDCHVAVALSDVFELNVSHVVCLLLFRVDEALDEPALHDGHHDGGRDHCKHGRRHDEVPFVGGVAAARRRPCGRLR